MKCGVSGSECGVRRSSLECGEQSVQSVVFTECRVVECGVSVVWSAECGV